MSEINNSIDSLPPIPLDANIRSFGSFLSPRRSMDFGNIFKDSINPFGAMSLNKNSGFNQPNQPQQYKLNAQFNGNFTNQRFGGTNLQIGEVYSQSQSYHLQDNNSLESIFNEKQKITNSHKQRQNQNFGSENYPEYFSKKVASKNQEKYDYKDYFGPELAQCLKQRQIPLQYIRGLLMKKNIKELKTKRRIKVQRYLKKRRNKTWNRKICYGCRQKVAGERLRIKGKFIKKRTAMRILNITIPIQLHELKERLMNLLQNKSEEQVEELFNNPKQLIP